MNVFTEPNEKLLGGVFLARTDPRSRITENMFTLVVVHFIMCLLSVTVNTSELLFEFWAMNLFFK